MKARPEALRIIGVNGNTMEPLFHSGDHLLIDIDRRAASLAADLKCSASPRPMNADMIVCLGSVLVRLSPEQYPLLRDGEAICYQWRRGFVSGAMARTPDAASFRSTKQNAT